jgi:flavodoxin
MSKILIAYFSLTGNTKKIAETIHDTVEGDKTIKPVDDVQEVEDYTLIFIGFPVHSHSVPFKTESLLKRIPAGKKVALFSTRESAQKNPRREKSRSVFHPRFDHWKPSFPGSSRTCGRHSLKSKSPGNLFLQRKSFLRSA